MSKKTLITLITIIGIILFVFIVFFTIPANYKSSIKVNQHEIDHFKGDNKVANVVVFNDLHLLYDYQVEDLDKLIETINQANPDIVIFNGDLFDNDSYEKNTKQNSKIVNQLKKIKPLYGKFAILGEQDKKNKDVKKILNRSDFEVINNKVRKININNKSFYIIGFSDKIKTNIVKQLPDKKLNIAFSHSPKNVDKLSKYKIDVIVTAHTLGGQYNLPIYGSLFKDIRAIPYYKGTHNINGSMVYNSNGIGIYQSSMRFLAPSSIEQFIIK